MTENPYTAPQTQPQNITAQTQPNYIELASRWARLGAACIDGIIMSVIFAPLIFLLLVLFPASSGVETGSNLSNMSAASDSTMASFIIGSIGILVYVAINGYFLVKSGQSIGKKILSIQIVSRDTHQLLSFGKIVGIRYVATVIITQLPLIGRLFGIIDVLMIFGSEKRCIHDRMAGTIVIKSSSI